MEFCGTTGEVNCKCYKPTPKITSMQVDLKSTLRKLWTDHGVYTKFAINSLVDGGTNITAISNRLMSNQQDIGKQLSLVLNVNYGTMLTGLLKQHISLAVEVIKEAVFSSKQNTNREAIMNNKVNALLSNSRSVVQALSLINAFKIPLQKLNMMFDRQNAFVIEMTKARISKDYKLELEMYDGYYNELLEMSDMIYSGL